ncbi:hypothetical protein RHOSPDRAFT_31164 [Rhodotorula sp. JG-1b]|nr:hypothetical protein RHOSPDRAFT_31164 [Rhodotorula sp. JG-1b]
MLKFFGGASHAQDQTTPKATDQRNPFDLLGASASSSAASSRKASIAPATTPGAPGSRTPVRPSLSHAASSTRSLGSNAGSEPATPGVTPGGSSRAQPTTGSQEQRTDLQKKLLDCEAVMGPVRSHRADCGSAVLAS